RAARSPAMGRAPGRSTAAALRVQETRRGASRGDFVFAPASLHVFHEKSRLELAGARNGLIAGTLDHQIAATERFLLRRGADLSRLCEGDACLVLTARPIRFGARRQSEMSYVDIRELMLGKGSPLYGEPLYILLRAGPPLRRVGTDYRR